MLGNDYGAGEALQAFLQMRQFHEQNRAAREQRQALTDSGVGILKGGEAGAIAPGMPGAPQGPAALGQPMPTQMQGPSAPSGPAAPGGGGQPSSPGSTMHPAIAAALPHIVSALGGGQPQQPPPPDPNLSPVGDRSTGNPQTDAAGMVQSIARAIVAAKPGIPPYELAMAVRQQLDTMKGVAPEVRAANQIYLGNRNEDGRNSRAEAKNYLTMDVATMNSQDRAAARDAAMARVRELDADRDRNTDTREAGADRRNERTTSTSRANNRDNNSGRRYGQDLAHGDRMAAEGGRMSRAQLSAEIKRNAPSSRYNADSEWGKNYRAARNSGASEEAASAEATRQTRGGGSSSGAGPPRPKTPAEAAKLKPGTQFVDPNGVVRTR
jgi:hypothetical protein